VRRVSTEDGRTRWPGQNGAGHVKPLAVLKKITRLKRCAAAAICRKRAYRRVRLHHAWNWPTNQVCKEGACAVHRLHHGAQALGNGAAVGADLAEVLDFERARRRVQHDQRRQPQAVRLGDFNHPDIELVSFTSSTRAGVLVAQAAPYTVKQVRRNSAVSPNIIRADIAKAVTGGVRGVLGGSDPVVQTPATACWCPRRR
jgi:hypothetical protein